jgi:hypothetical protein
MRNRVGWAWSALAKQSREHAAEGVREEKVWRGDGREGGAVESSS